MLINCIHYSSIVAVLSVTYMSFTAVIPHRSFSDTTTHTKCIEESIFQLSIDADEDGFVASDESHPSSHKPH